MATNLLIDSLKFLPLASVAVWWGLAVYQVARDRYRTWTEVFFLVACLFTGTYALSDFFFFTAPSQEAAAIAALVSFSVLTLAVVFFMLFAVVFYTRMRRALLLAFVPALVLIPGLWLYLVPYPDTQIQQLQQYPGLWVGSWDRTWFVVWVLVAMAYSVVMAYALLRTYREVAHQSTNLRRRMLGLFVATLLALVLGTATNTLRGYFNYPVPPMFSTALVLPGIVSVITLSPLSRERFSAAVRRWKASSYQVKAAFLIFSDGTLIGAKVRPGEKVIDQDLFSATLDVIQNFMRTSFPALRGSLSAIRHGDYTLVMERGRHAYVTVVLEGEENDQLRRYIRDLLLNYEVVNRTSLSDWRGVPSEATGTEELLDALLRGA